LVTGSWATPRTREKDTSCAQPLVPDAPPPAVNVTAENDCTADATAALSTKATSTTLTIRDWGIMLIGVFFVGLLVCLFF
jgi:hypothetical protein